MTELKDAYKLREENYLGKTGQIRMEVNAVNNQVQNAPVFYPATNPTPNMRVTLARECEDTLNCLGNCYGCNKRTTVIRRDTMPGSVGDRRKTTNVTTLRKKRE